MTLYGRSPWLDRFPKARRHRHFRSHRGHLDCSIVIVGGGLDRMRGRIRVCGGRRSRRRRRSRSDRPRDDLAGRRLDRRRARHAVSVARAGDRPPARQSARGRRGAAPRSTPPRRSAGSDVKCDLAESPSVTAWRDGGAGRAPQARAEGPRARRARRAVPHRPRRRRGSCGGIGRRASR